MDQHVVTAIESLAITIASGGADWADEKRT
jgi:hypothetical protein